MQLLLVSSVDYRLPKHIAAHIKRQEAEDKGDTLGPMYTEPTVMSPVKRDEPTEGSDSRVDLQNPLFKDVGRQPIDPPHVVAAHHDSTIASIAGGSTLGSTLQAPSTFSMTIENAASISQQQAYQDLLHLLLVLLAAMLT